LSNDHYSYLVGVLTFWEAWIFCCIFEKNYRAKIRTLIATPMALGAPLRVLSCFNFDLSTVTCLP
jgi:hypothetical protein